MTITVGTLLTATGDTFNEWRRNTNKTTYSVGDLTTIYTTDGAGADQVAATVANLLISDVFTATANGTEVTVTCSTEHNLNLNDQVYVSGVTPSGYNGGPFAITPIDDYKFKYTVLSAPGTFVSDGEIRDIQPDVITVVKDLNTRKVKRSGDSISYLKVTDSTASTSTTTGALVVTGGTGIGGKLYLGNDFTVGSNKLVVAAASGNTSVAGTLTVAGTTDLNGVVTIDGADVSTTIAPTGTGSVTLNPATAGTINNMSIGATTAAAGTFTTMTTSNAQVSGGAINGTTIGASIASTGAFTSLTANTPAVDNNSTNVATTAYYMGQAGTVNPSMNSSASVGSSTRWSRVDHVHPSDTTRLVKAGDTATGKISFPAVSGSITGSINIPNGSGNTAVSGDMYATSGIMYWHNGTAVKTLAFTDSNITGTSSNVTGTVAIANGGTGLTSVTAPNYVMGANSAGNAIEYKQMINGTGINITHGVGTLTISSDGTLPSGSSTDTTFRIGQNLLVGSWNGTSHNAIVNTNALEVRPGSGVSITNLLNITSDNAGANTVFKVNASGDLTIGANKFTVATSTGNTVVAGTLSVAGHFLDAATFDSTLATVDSVSVGTSVGKSLTVGVNSVMTTYQTITTSTSQTTLASVVGSSYRTAKFIIQCSKDSGTDYQAVEMLAIHDGTSADHTEYGVVSRGALLATFTVDYSGGNMRLLVTPQTALSTTFRVTAFLSKV
jgi:hypothetical protein